METDFHTTTIDNYYDNFFNGRKGHNYTDEQIEYATTEEDIKEYLKEQRKILYKHFGIKGE